MADKTARSDPPTTDRWQPSRLSHIAHLLLLAGAAVAVFLAGRAQQGNLGVFLVLAGAALVFLPPQGRVPWKIWAIAATVLLMSSLALLPGSWFPEPTWRQSLTAAGVPLVSSVTPMIRETWFWLAVLSVAICASLFTLAHPLGSKAQLQLAVVATLICGFYASLAIYVRQSGWDAPFAFDPGTFGFFPNRNHTATLLVTGSIVALGILGVAFRGPHWIAGSLAAASLAVCVAALIFFTTSRGGIISLFFGTVLWLGGLGSAHRSKPLLVSFAAVLLGSVLLFLASQSVLRERVLKLTGLAQDRVSEQQPRDGRLLIFEDTLRIVRDFPLTGTGLGTFRYVFPLYRQKSSSDIPAIHPEGDWLMLAAEAGIPALLAFLAGVIVLLRRVWPLRDHAYWPLRWGILCAALAALGHGFVDVPAHRTGLGWWILVIAGIGFQAPPRERLRPSRIQHLLLLLAGFGACALGLPLIRAEWFGGPASPPFSAFAAQPEIIALRVGGQVPEAAEAARRAIAKSPLADRLYLQLGATLLHLPGKESEADAAFRAQRLLNPDPPQIPIDQGLLWINIDRTRTAALWIEALQRRERIDRQIHRGEQGTLALYENLLGRAANYPDLQRQLLSSFPSRPPFVLVGLERVAPAVSAEAIPRLASDTVFLESLAEAERRRFVQAWYARGAREALLRFVEDHPDWEEAAWPIQVRQLIDAEKFEEVTRAVADRYKISIILPPPDSTGSEIRASDPAGPVELFNAAWRKGNTVTARRVLEEARAGAAVPPEIWRLSAAWSARESKWRDAWQNLDRYLRGSGLDALP